MGKKKSSKKLFPRRYASDFINTNRGVDQTKTQAYDFLNNRSRTRSTKGRRDQAEPVLENTFTRDVPKTISKQRYFGYDNDTCREYFAKRTNPMTGETEAKKHIVVEETEAEIEQHARVWLPTPRAKALHDRARAQALPKTLYAMVQGARLQKVVEYNCTVLEKVNRYKLCILFAGTEFLFVMETNTGRWISATYSSRDEAMAAFYAQNISWLTREDID